MLASSVCKAFLRVAAQLRGDHGLRVPMRGYAAQAVLPEKVLDSELAGA
jgi:hypothetical protein